MIHTLWHTFRFWTNGIVLTGLLLTAAECSSVGLQQTVTPIAKVNPPPEIIGFTLVPPAPVLPEARIRIQVNVKRNDHKIDTYWWVIREGEGDIVRGQGTCLVTYQVPKTPGSYEVRVELEYKGGPPVKGTTTVEVVQPSPTSTATPTDTPTPTSTATPTPSPTKTDTPIPTPIHTPTDTPTPTPTYTPIPPPVLNQPEDGANLGSNVTFSWHWDGELQENEYFDLRMWPKDSDDHRIGVMDFRAIPSQPNANGEYVVTTSIVKVGDSDRPIGIYYWSVVVMREMNGNIVDVSPEAIPRKLTFDTSTGDGGGGGSVGGNSGDGGKPEPPLP